MPQASLLLLDQVPEGARLNLAGRLKGSHIIGLEPDDPAEAKCLQVTPVDKAVDGARVDSEPPCRSLGAHPLNLSSLSGGIYHVL